MPRELLLHLNGQTAHGRIIEISGQCQRLMVSLAFDLCLLTHDIAGIFELYLNLLNYLGRFETAGRSCVTAS